MLMIVKVRLRYIDRDHGMTLRWSIRNGHYYLSIMKRWRKNGRALETKKILIVLHRLFLLPAAGRRLAESFRIQPTELQLK